MISMRLQWPRYASFGYVMGYSTDQNGRAFRTAPRRRRSLPPYNEVDARGSLLQRANLFREVSHRESVPFELAVRVAAQHDPKTLSF